MNPHLSKPSVLPLSVNADVTQIQNGLLEYRCFTIGQTSYCYYKSSMSNWLFIGIVSGSIAVRHLCNPSNAALKEKIKYCNTRNKPKLGNGARTACGPSILISQSLSSPYPFSLKSLAQPYLVCHSSFHVTVIFLLFFSFCLKGSLSIPTQYKVCLPHLYFSHIQGF